MAGYIAEAIIEGRMTYIQVVPKWMKFKEEIDRLLIEKYNRGDLIPEKYK